LHGQEYLLKDFSAVDISVGYSVYVAKYFVDLGQYKALSAWIGHLQRRDAFVKTMIPQGRMAIYQKDFYGVQP
jgi:glutathione S-transferase